MAIERKLLSELAAEVRGLSNAGLVLGAEDSRLGRYVTLRHANGELLCSFAFDDLFDADGNRFEDDLPICPTKGS